VGVGATHWGQFNNNHKLLFTPTPVNFFQEMTGMRIKGIDGDVGMEEVSISVLKMTEMLHAMAQGEAPAGEVTQEDALVFMVVMSPAMSLTVSTIEKEIVKANARATIDEAIRFLEESNGTDTATH
jgi:hypothetical protein